MNVKEFLKPSILKILISLFIAVLYLYSAGESACGAGFFFAFCYKAYGFPFLYAVTGDINTASDYLKTLPLGGYFIKSWNFLFNPAAFLLDMVFIYLLSCLVLYLIKARH